ncbi:MAG: hypothetical protein KKC55_14785 [Gammaproteobacteria bacterium]|uniref:Uncharacterized protein n=1 Tax=viral metagenome TaxID=1070528 RepID=A0A6H1ZXK6_9ZZZZ|nr:hypothetical protein [Gammaproteobacteria bacterium]
MILPIYLSETKHGDIITRLNAEPNRSAIVQAALALYYAKQGANADLLFQISGQLDSTETKIERLLASLSQLLENREGG